MSIAKPLIATAIATLACAAWAAGEHPGHGSHWGYKGDIGPEKWTALKPEFTACAGKNQSPINDSGTIDAQLKPIKFDYKAGGSEVINNGAYHVSILDQSVSRNLIRENFFILSLGSEAATTHFTRPTITVFGN